MAIRFEVNEDNESVTLDVHGTASDVGLDPSTDGSADADEPVRLSVRVALDGEGHARTRLSVAALGLTLTDAVAGREPRYLDYSEATSALRAVLDRVAPSWRDWVIDAECQLENEAAASGDEAWLEALDQRPANVFGCG